MGEYRTLEHLTFLPFLPGYIFLGIAIARAGVFSRWAGLLMIAAALLFALPWPWPIPVAGALAYAVALSWLGYGLWSEKGVMMPAPIPAV